jgi:hypothetical protein
MRLWKTAAAQLPGYLLDERAPTAAFVLAEPAHGRVPDRVGSAQEPPPIRCEPNESSDRLPQSSGQMGRGGSSADYQVQLPDHASRIQEVPELPGWVLKMGQGVHIRLTARGQRHLQTIDVIAASGESEQAPRNEVNGTHRCGNPDSPRKPIPLSDSGHRMTAVFTQQRLQGVCRGIVSCVAPGISGKLMTEVKQSNRGIASP